MKKAIMLLVTAFALALVANAWITYEVSIKGAFAKVKFRIIDQDGVPVPNAKIWGAFSANRSKDSVLVDGATNTNGEFTAQGKCNEFLRVDVTKEGYYHTEVKVHFWRSKADPLVVDGKWQPYGETRTVVLKKIRKMGTLSVPNMNEYSNRERKIPVFNQWIPFDLEKFDWNAPHGKGTHADVLLRFRNRITPCYYDFTYCMDICFTNNPFAGAYEARKDITSTLKTVYEADSNATYRSNFTFTLEKTVDGKRTSEYLKEDAYFVYRTRTTVDEHGRLKSAYYGSILGPWLSGKSNMRTYDGCFNPIANGSSIEDGFYLREEVRHCDKLK